MTLASQHYNQMSCWQSHPFQATGNRQLVYIVVGKRPYFNPLIIGAQANGSLHLWA